MGKAWFTDYPHISVEFEDLTIIDVKDGFWLDIKGEKINENVVFGEKVKIKLITEKSYNGSIDVVVVGRIGNKEKKLSEKEPLSFNVEIKNGTGISEEILIDPEWYEEELEEYDEHKTVIKPDKLLVLTFKATLKEFPKKDEDKLIPLTYRRNYEELMGLYKYENPPQEINNTSQKDSVNNIENHFINSNNNIKSIVYDFISQIHKENITAENLWGLVNEYSKKLWNTSVTEFQKGQLDDRPLYWARIKMQVYLKRHPIYKEDFNLENSLIYKGTKLESVITNFEKYSRNYTGIKFKKNKNVKNILITGFDPFGIGDNPLQSNPSGLVALKFHNKNLKKTYIQTMIFPVRYADFDSCTTPKKGNGSENGVIDTYIGKIITENPDVDAIITVSETPKKDYHFEVFATYIRGGAEDNMKYTRINHKIEDYTPSIPNLATNLPKSFENNGAIFFGKYFKTNEEKKGYRYYKKKKEMYPISTEKHIYENEILNKPNSQTLEQNLKIAKKSYFDYENRSCDRKNIPQKDIYEAPGGNFLSNEIFYRVTTIRTWSNTPELPTGHFHIPKIQEKGENLDNKKTKDLLKKIKKIFKKGFLGIKKMKNEKS